jgi:CRP/FNR family transcriptional regulator, cyclic AMP receptor protein
MEGRTTTASLVDTLAQTALFADLARPELEAVAHEFEEEAFAPGQRALRQGLSGSGLYVILDGSAAVMRDGQPIAHLGRGDFFGEISVLLGGVPIADVRAETLLRCLVLPGPQVEAFLLDHPMVMLRMLQTLARRLRDTSRWS